LIAPGGGDALQHQGGRAMKQFHRTYEDNEFES
jgi:hypothetical protein